MPEAVSGHILSTPHRCVIYAVCEVPGALAPLAAGPGVGSSGASGPSQGHATTTTTTTPTVTTGLKVKLRPFSNASGLSRERAVAVHVPVCPRTSLVTNADVHRRVASPGSTASTPPVAPTVAAGGRSREGSSGRKEYYLSACVWTKATYRNRFGKIISDGAARLPEWLTYHLLMGVEHFYLYDNFDEKVEGEAVLLFLGVGARHEGR